MIVYIQKLIDEVLQIADSRGKDGGLATRVQVLSEEVDRLDPRDFLPAAQFTFVDQRRRLRSWNDLASEFWDHLRHYRRGGQFIPGSDKSAMQAVSILDDPSMVETLIAHPLYQYSHAHEEFRQAFVKDCGNLKRVLDSYGGKDCRLVQRQFPFVTNVGLRKIVERDYRELSMILFPGSAWKSTVVMAGSILEAILYDQLTKDATRVISAMAAVNAPKKRKGTLARDILSDKPEDDWKLKDLIEVSVELGIIVGEREKTIDHVLRDFRNFVHTRAELQSKHELGEADATLAKGALEAVYDLLK